MRGRDMAKHAHNAVTIERLEASVCEWRNTYQKAAAQRDELAATLKSNEEKYIRHNETIDDLMVMTTLRGTLETALRGWLRMFSTDNEAGDVTFSYEQLKGRIRDTRKLLGEEGDPQMKLDMEGGIQG